MAEQLSVAIRFKRLCPAARIPTRATVGSVCWDIYATSPAWLVPGFDSQPVRTGLAVELPAGWGLEIAPRSGLGGKRGTKPANSPAIIDQDFRGEIVLYMYNTGVEPVAIQPGDRIAQCRLIRVQQASWLEVEELSYTARGLGGFGSTGT